VSETIDFSMTKRRFLAFAVCVGLGVVVLYLAGIVTGLLIRSVAPASKTGSVKSPVVTAAVKPPAGTPPSPKTDPSAGGGATQTHGLTVQVASFRDRDRAERFAASLKRQGFGAASIDEVASADQTWHVVRLGPYQDWNSAAQVAEEIGRSYDLHCSVVPI